jgi:hypothetical protein
MRKLTLLLAVLALAAVPSVADAAKKGKKRTAAAPPAATQQAPRPQMAPGESAVRVIAGGARELSRIGQPPPPPAAKKGKK